MSWGFFIFAELVVMGAGVLILLVAFESTRVHRSQAPTSQSAGADESGSVLRGRAFEGAPALSPASGPDGALVARFQQYLRAEQAEAEEFVESPSFTTLYNNHERALALN